MDKVTRELGPRGRARGYCASMRRCFHCGTRMEGARLTKVGDGEFCEPCFRSLLLEDSTSKQPEHELHRGATASLNSGPKSARVSSSVLRCLVCNRGLSQSAAVAFLGGVLCPECNREMSAELPRLPSSCASSKGASSTQALDEIPISAMPFVDETERPRFTPGGETRWCAGCERPMPGPGSYRMLDGKPYCSACVPFYLERKLVQQSSIDGSHPLAELSSTLDSKKDK